MGSATSKEPAKQTKRRYKRLKGSKVAQQSPRSAKTTDSSIRDQVHVLSKITVAPSPDWNDGSTKTKRIRTGGTKGSRKQPLNNTPVAYPVNADKAQEPFAISNNNSTLDRGDASRVKEMRNSASHTSTTKFVVTELERRPRRVQAKPDYRIRKMRELARDANPNKRIRSPSPSAREIYERLQPSFVQLVCEWRDCGAMLNNMDTLRRHIGVAHGQQASKERTCQWGTCQKEEAELGEGELLEPGSRITFATLQALGDHVEQDHMTPLYWHMGDGRTGGGIVFQDVIKKTPKYLLCEGFQITPSIKDQKIETIGEWRARKALLREMLARTLIEPQDGHGDGLHEGISLSRAFTGCT
ncbi:hypothetical protein BD289DRAFT_451542 [Coniella lustricola]|uniref:C2H2-type domain-containing protein n=1 Tax=Coniella lustricola TaxID=2025994 RepID=A0A2T3AEE8_9PEZI|nr:hypothetical protein BD289DRAFT_451542 [Coniella lustricola]